MTWRDLKIRNKVGIGFGTVILLTIASSAILLINLLRVDKEIKSLSNRYIPSVNESSKMNHYWDKTSGYINAYDLSNNIFYDTEADKNLESFTQALNKLVDLSDTATDNKGVNLSNIKVVANKFQDRKNKSTQNEQIVNDQIISITALNTQLNKAGLNYNNSFSTQKALAKANHLHIQIISNTNNKDVDAISLLHDQAEGLKNIPGTPREINEILIQLSNTTTAFIPIYRKAKLVELQKYESAKELMWEVRKASELGLDYLLEMGENSAAIVNQEKQILIASLILVLIIGASLSFFLANSISKPLVKGIALAEQAAKGDLNVSFSSDSKDEVGRLATALDTMVGNVRTVVNEISESAVKMVNASEKLSQESTDLSEGASEQASAAEEVSSSMEEMYANIQQNTDNSKETERIAVNAVEGMKISNNSSEEAKTSLEKITEKISIIGDIAFQTNILALNAAVEAARAGQEGRGFAVVASEVRKLAEKSQDAANEINTASQNTLNSSSEAHNNLLQITPEIEKTATLVQEITNASLEQVAGVEQINNALQQLNQITQRNASNSEEINSAAKELEQLSYLLKKSISVFNTDKAMGAKEAIHPNIENAPKIKTPHKVPKPSQPGKLIIDLGKEIISDDYETF